MAYAPHILIAFGGTAYGVDRWTCGLRLTNPGAGGPDETDYEWCQDNVNDAKDDVIAWFGANGVASYRWTLDSVKMNPIGADGKYRFPDTVERHFTAVPGANVAPAPPPQCCVAVSLLTAQARGRASRGRFFAPPPGGDLAANGVIPGAVVEQMTDAAQTLLNNLNNWAGIDPTGTGATLGIFSRIDGSHHAITGVTIGRVYDTQRRRRRSFDEKPYSSIRNVG